MVFENITFQSTRQKTKKDAGLNGIRGNIDKT
jgi:hypothetical protein